MFSDLIIQQRRTTMISCQCADVTCEIKLPISVDEMMAIEEGLPKLVDDNDVGKSYYFILADHKIASDELVKTCEGYLIVSAFPEEDSETGTPVVDGEGEATENVSPEATEASIENNNS